MAEWYATYTYADGSDFTPLEQRPVPQRGSRGKLIVADTQDGAAEVARRQHSSLTSSALVSIIVFEMTDKPYSADSIMPKIYEP